MSGFVFAFSNVVMPSLGRVDPRAGIEAMQTINVVVGNPLFSALLAGTTLLSLALGAVAVFNPGSPGTALLLTGSLAYLASGIGVTAAFNVPMNRRLAGVDAASPDGAAHWRHFLARWTFWNHVRTAGSAGASLAFGLALLQL